MNTRAIRQDIASGHECESLRLGARSLPQSARASSDARGSNADMKIGQYGRELMWAEADIDEVRALYTRAMEGWNIGSGEAFAAPFAEEADFVAFDGERFRGREEIARF